MILTPLFRARRLHGKKEYIEGVYGHHSDGVHMNPNGLGGDLIFDNGDNGVMIFNSVTHSIVMKVGSETYGFYKEYFQRAEVTGVYNG